MFGLPNYQKFDLKTDCNGTGGGLRCEFESKQLELDILFRKLGEMEYKRQVEINKIASQKDGHSYKNIEKMNNIECVYAAEMNAVIDKINSTISKMERTEVKHE